MPHVSALPGSRNSGLADRQGRAGQDGSCVCCAHCAAPRGSYLSCRAHDVSTGLWVRPGESWSSPFALAFSSVRSVLTLQRVKTQQRVTTLWLRNPAKRLCFPIQNFILADTVLLQDLADSLSFPLQVTKMRGYM